MVRNVDHENRKRAVLAAAINRYIRNAQPVSSEELAGEFSVSSATIRSILAELESEGYLKHPHTSSGRIPTDKGYRHYVDFLSSQIMLLEDEKESIVTRYRKEMTRLEDALEETSEVLSAITHYASIVSFLEWHDRFFYKGIRFILDQPEFQDHKRIRLVISMIEEKQRLLDILNRDFSGKVKVYIGGELGCDEMRDCSLAVTSYSVKNKPSGRVAVLGPSRMQYEHIIPALEYVSSILSDVLERM